MERANRPPLFASAVAACAFNRFTLAALFLAAVLTDPPLGPISAIHFFVP
jgi:hypothetical protein